MSEPAGLITVTANDALDDVIGRIRDAAVGGQPVTLAIPAASALFLTASEFRVLKSAVERGRIVVTVRSADPLRLQLARMLGLDATPEARPRSRAVPAPAAPVASRPAAAAPSPSTRSPATRPPAVQTTTASAPATAKKPAPAPVVAPPPATAPATTTKKKAKPAPPAAPPSEPPPPPPPTPATEEQAVSESVAATADANATDSPDEAEDGAWPEPPPPRQRPRPLPIRERLKRVVAPRSGAPKTVDPSPPVEAVASEASEADAEPVAETPEDGAPPETTTDDAGAAPWWRRVSPRAVPFPVRIAIAAITVLLVAALGYAILAPRAAVSVVLAREPVAASLIYDVTADGSPLDDGAEFAIEAERQTVDVVFEGSIPTTGMRTEPDATAMGEIQLANATAEEIVVERGTIVSTEAGLDFATDEAVTVPGADPNDGRSGTVSVPVRALEPGTGGNIGVGEIGGQLESGVYFSNRERPTEGGTDRSIPIVAAEDLAALQTQATAELPSLAESAFSDEYDGMVPLPGSLVTGRGSDEFSAEEGAAAERLSVRIVRPMTALVYDPDVVREEAAAELQERLDAESPAGYRLDEETLALEEATAIEDQETGTRFELEATAESRVDFTSDERRQIAEELAGKDPADAATILEDQPQIERFEIAYYPSWFPNRMPSNADRISWEFDQ